VLVRTIAGRVALRDWAWRAGVPSFAAAIILHDLYAALFLRWAVFGWHFVLSDLLVCMLVPMAFERALESVPASLRAPAWTASLLLVVVIGALFVWRRDWGSVSKGSWRGTAYDAALWVRDHLPADATIGMTDCGYMGLFSDRRVVNLDGLVNGFEYQEYLRRGRFRAFLDSSGVSYIASHSGGIASVIDGHYRLTPFEAWSHLYDVSGGRVELAADNEVYRSQPYWSDGKKFVAIVWRRGGR